MTRRKRTRSPNPEHIGPILDRVMIDLLTTIEERQRADVVSVVDDPSVASCYGEIVE